MLLLEDLKNIADDFGGDLNSSVTGFELAGISLDFNSRPYLMGVINLSPDSWYRESVCLTTQSAAMRARRLLAEGADLVDVGAESSILSAERVAEQAQLAKLLPVVRTLAQDKILVSVETYYPSVAEACLNAGASLLNL